jgi:hypothetical protein
VAVIAIWLLAAALLAAFLGRLLAIKVFGDFVPS